MSRTSKWLTELIATLRSDRPLSRSQREWLADRLDPEGAGDYRLVLGRRGRGRLAGRTFNVSAWEAGDYVYSRVAHGGRFKTAVAEACARYGLGTTKVKEQYSQKKKAGAPPKPLGLFDKTASDAEREVVGTRISGVGRKGRRRNSRS